MVSQIELTKNDYLARVGRNSKAYSAERKYLHTAHYVSLMRPTKTQSTLKQPHPATRMDIASQSIFFMFNWLFLSLK